MKQKNSAQCPMGKCDGILFDVTPAIAESMGVQHRQCDKCGCKMVYYHSEFERDMLNRLALIRRANDA